MRVDDVRIYHLPTLAACCPKCCEQGVVVVEKDDNEKTSLTEEELTVVPAAVNTTTRLFEEEVLNNLAFTNGISFDLPGLPLYTEGTPDSLMPVGSRGWYASAVLSAMLLLGHDELHQDVFHNAKKNIKKNQNSQQQDDFTVLELGSGAIGLTGMAMAWILAQQQQQQNQQEKTNFRVILSDNDDLCLKQLELNVNAANQTLQERFLVDHDQEQQQKNMIRVGHLDWSEYEDDQPLLMEHETIDFVLGAALVYTPDNSCCASQVAKILKANPHAIVWIVQYPREGWFQVLQLQLQRLLPDIVKIQKFLPTDMHPHIHILAQRLIPRQWGIKFDFHHIKAIRISLLQEVVEVEADTNA